MLRLYDLAVRVREAPSASAPQLDYLDPSEGGGRGDDSALPCIGSMVGAHVPESSPISSVDHPVRATLPHVVAKGSRRYRLSLMCEPRDVDGSFLARLRALACAVGKASPPEVCRRGSQIECAKLVRALHRYLGSSRRSGGNRVLDRCPCSSRLAKIVAMM